MTKTICKGCGTTYETYCPLCAAMADEDAFAGVRAFDDPATALKRHFCSVCGERDCTKAECDVELARENSPEGKRRAALLDSLAHCKPHSIAYRRYQAEIERLDAHTVSR